MTNNGEDQKYNGWSNKDTYKANLRLAHTENVYPLAMECIDEFALNDLFEEVFGPVAGSATYADNIDPNRVNWAEIFESLHEGEEK